MAKMSDLPVFAVGETIRFPWFNDIGNMVIAEGEVKGKNSTCWIVEFRLDGEMTEVHLDFKTPNLHRPIQS